VLNPTRSRNSRPPDIPVTDDLVERCFASESMKNARLREAWDNRLRSEQDWRRADELIEDSTRGLMKFLKSQPDSEATADRNGDLSDRDFANEKRSWELGENDEQSKSDENEP